MAADDTLRQAIVAELRGIQRVVRDSLDRFGDVTPVLKNALEQELVQLARRIPSAAARPAITEATVDALRESPATPDSEDAMWISVLGDSTCGVCEQLHGTVKEYDEWYESGEVPGGAAGPCLGGPRCRCRLVPVVDADGQRQEIPEPIRRGKEKPKQVTPPKSPSAPKRRGDTLTVYHGAHSGFRQHVGQCFTDEKDTACAYAQNKGELAKAKIDTTGLKVQEVPGYDRDTDTSPLEPGYPHKIDEDTDILVFDDEDPTGNPHRTWRMMSDKAVDRVSVVRVQWASTEKVVTELRETYGPGDDFDEVMEELEYWDPEPPEQAKEIIARMVVGGDTPELK